MKSEKNIKDELRAQYSQHIKDMFAAENVEIFDTAAGTFYIEVPDSEGQLRWVKISVIIPNASEEEATDGRALAEEYQMKLDAAADRKTKAEVKAAEAKAKREAKIAAKIKTKD